MPVRARYQTRASHTGKPRNVPPPSLEAGNQDRHFEIDSERPEFEDVGAQMLSYFALFEPDQQAGGFVIQFPDFGYGATQGETFAQANEMAEDLLKCLVQEEIRKGSPLPAPVKHRGKRFLPVSLSALQSAKAELYMAFRASGIKKAELARRIGISKTNIERLFDLDHASRLDQIEDAFRVIGKKLEVTIRNAA